MACWLDDVLVKSAPAPHPSCPATNAPRVAFLIGGVTRGFDRERMRRAFLQHVVEPLAPTPANRAVFLALKKLERTQKMGMRIAGFVEMETNSAALKAGVASQFSGATLHLSHLPVDREVIAKESSRQSPISNSMGPGFKPHPCNCTCFELLRPAVAGFVTAIRRSYLMMRERETAQGWNFDLVVFSRPDLIFFAPLASWCDPRWQQVMAGRALTTIGQDFMYVLPRSVATTLDETLTHSMTTRASKGQCRFAVTENLGRLLTIDAIPALRLQVSAPGQDAALVRAFSERDPSCPIKPHVRPPFQSEEMPTRAAPGGVALRAPTRADGTERAVPRSERRTHTDHRKRLGSQRMH